MLLLLLLLLSKNAKKLGSGEKIGRVGSHIFSFRLINRVVFKTVLHKFIENLKSSNLNVNGSILFQN